MHTNGTRQLTQNNTGGSGVDRYDVKSNAHADVFIMDSHLVGMRTRVTSDIHSTSFHLRESLEHSRSFVSSRCRYLAVITVMPIWLSQTSRSKNDLTTDDALLEARDTLRPTAPEKKITI